MTSTAAQRFRVFMNIKEMVSALGLFYGLNLFMLTPKAYWSRFRAGRSLFSPTFSQPKDFLPTTSMENRILHRDPYLRPTPHCNSHAPQIIALADKLRHHAVNDWRYAQVIYGFVRNDISFAYETLPRHGVVGTLAKGYGICLSKLHLLIALARAGGIPARYSIIGNVDLVEAMWFLSRIHSIDHMLDTVEASSHEKPQSIIPGLKQMLKQLKNNVSVGIAPELRWHPLAELKIGGYWIPADPTWADTEAAALGLPLPRLGYDPVTMLGLTGSTISRSEALPLKRSFGIAWNLYCLLFRGANDNLNRVLEEVKTRGYEILEQTGRDEYMRSMQRFYIPVPGVTALNLPLDQGV